MQRLITILLISASLVLGCSDDDPKPKVGCMTGIPKIGDPVRTFFRCGTQEEFNAGSNVGAGGSAAWTSFTQHQWEPISDCSKCN